MSSASETDTVLGDGSLGETLEDPHRDDRTIGASGLRRGSMLGRYVVLDRLGVGGMGLVVSAYDPELDRKVAIKLLRGESGSKADSRSQRLLREAKSLARLVHPNVISVYDVGALEGSVFVAMEYIEGETLEERMEAWQRDKASWKEIVRVFLAAGRGLVAAHGKGIVHRDFKPANAMIAADGRVVVLDFGLALGVAEESESGEDASPLISDCNARLTRTGTMLGTPAYMAPEQMARHSVGPSADQYSFCVALYQALYGHRPFRGDSLPELVGKVLTGDIEAPASSQGVPGWLHKVVLRGLSREPDDRFPSMAALLQALGADPARRIRAWAFGTGAVASAAGLVFAGSSLSETEPCEAVSMPVADVWNEGVGVALRKRFETVEGAFGRGVADRVVPRLDAYAARWAQGRQDACEANRIRAEASDVVMLSRALCYDRSLSALEGWVDAFRIADAQAVRAAPASIESLPGLGECESSQVSVQRVEVVSDPHVRAEVRRVQGRIGQLQARLSAADLDGLHDDIIELEAAAEALGVKSVLARVHALHAFLLTATGEEPERREELARTAVLEAEASGDDDALIRSLQLLVRVTGQGRADLQAADDTLDRLEAVIERNGNSPEALRTLYIARGFTAINGGRLELAEENLLRVMTLSEEHGLPMRATEVDVLNKIATVFMRTNRIDEAEAMTMRALELGAEILGEDHPTNVMTEVSLGRLKYLSGDYDAALSSYRRAEVLVRARFPQGHPNLASIKNSRGLVLNAAKRHAEAREEFEAAIAMTIPRHGSDNALVGKLRTNLATALAGLGRYEDAIEERTDALRITRLVGGEGENSTFYNAMNLANLLRERGRLDEAEKLYTEANRWRLEHVGEDDPLRSEALHGLGEIALERGEIGAGLEFMTAAVALLSPKVEAFVRGRARFGLAKARWELGETAEARRLAEAAAEEYESGPASNRDGLEDVRAWLEAHPD